jgi:hypothetical protein
VSLHRSHTLVQAAQSVSGSFQKDHVDEVNIDKDDFVQNSTEAGLKVVGLERTMKKKNRNLDFGSFEGRTILRIDLPWVASVVSST